MKNNWGYNRAVVSLIIRKIPVRDMKFRYKNIFKIHNSKSIIQKVKKKFQRRKKNIEKIQMIFQKLINWRKIKNG